MDCIIRINKDTWEAPWWGDPGMTAKRENAKIYESKKEAQIVADKLIKEGYKETKVEKYGILS
jgi:hypothetical protein